MSPNGATVQHQGCWKDVTFFSDFDEVKEDCNIDRDCKGYAISTRYVRIATTSNCPAGYAPASVGDVASLLLNATECAKHYEKCFVKKQGEKQISLLSVSI